LATQSKKIHCITVTEVAVNDHYPVADVMMDGMGFARPLDFEPMLKTPGFIEMAWKAPIYLIAAGLGVDVEEVHGSLDRRTTARDIEVAFGTIPAGTCGAVRTRAAGVVNGREAIVIEHIIRMARDVAPDWLTSEFDATYRVDIECDPDIHCSMHLGETEVMAQDTPRWQQPPCGCQCHPVRHRFARRPAELTRHAEHVAAPRIRLTLRV
jgi:2,4-diaminopentanoate dehydrogenase